MIGIEMATYVATQRWFNRKRLLANGVSTSGTGFGMLVLAPLVQWLLSFYGLHGTFLILSGLALNGIVCGILIPSENPEESTDISPNSDKEVSTEFSSVNKIPSDEKSKLLNVSSDSPLGGFVRMLCNSSYVFFAIGSAVNFTVMKGVLGKFY